MNGFNGWLLGLSQGFQYNDASGTSLCTTTIASGAYASSAAGHIFSRIYLPWYWSEALQVTQDSIAIFGNVLNNCQTNKFINAITTLISVEGVTTLTGRVGGAFVNDFPAVF
jgi:hypothetical protein